MNTGTDATPDASPDGRGAGGTGGKYASSFFQASL